MLNKILGRLVLAISVLAFTFSGIGVYATWHFADKPTESTNFGFKVLMQDYVWDGSDILPDDENADQYGQNHMDLIQKIINDLRYGLNSTSSTLLHNYLEEKGDIVWCDQQVSGGNLKHLMIDGTDAYALMFQIEWISSTKYIIYTYIRDDAYQSIGTSINVYRTVVDKTDHWHAVETKIGTAPIIDPSAKKVDRGIDSSKWVEKTTTK